MELERARRADSGREQRAPYGMYLSAGALLVVAGACFAAAAFPHSAGTARLVIMAMLVGGFAVVVPDPRASASTALLGFLVYLGFLVNQRGELSWHHGQTGSQLLLFALAIGLGWGWRWLRRVAAAAEPPPSPPPYQAETPDKPRPEVLLGSPQYPSTESPARPGAGNGLGIG